MKRKEKAMASMNLGLLYRTWAEPFFYDPIHPMIFPIPTSRIREKKPVHLFINQRG
jgi:hypothetical protein